MKQQPTPAASEEPFEPLLDTEQTAALLKIHPKTLQKIWTFPTTRVPRCSDN